MTLGPEGESWSIDSLRYRAARKKEEHRRRCIQTRFYPFFHGVPFVQCCSQSHLIPWVKVCTEYIRRHHDGRRPFSSFPILPSAGCPILLVLSVLLFHADAIWMNDIFAELGRLSFAQYRRDTEGEVFKQDFYPYSEGYPLFPSHLTPKVCTEYPTWAVSFFQYFLPPVADPISSFSTFISCT